MLDDALRNKRSAVMSRVRSQGNKSTELRMIQVFRSAHIKGWRRNYALAGKPDFVFPHMKAVVFVDGCFWHGCAKCYRRPNSNQAYWDKKINGNIARDKRVTRQLRRLGWAVLRVREHEFKNIEVLKARLERFFNRAHSGMRLLNGAPENQEEKVTGSPA